MAGTGAGEFEGLVSVELALGQREVEVLHGGRRLARRERRVEELLQVFGRAQVLVRVLCSARHDTRHTVKAKPAHVYDTHTTHATRRKEESGVRKMRVAASVYWP
jgi:hypothetical protein